MIIEQKQVMHLSACVLSRIGFCQPYGLKPTRLSMGFPMARILERVAISSSSVSSRPRD